MSDLKFIPNISKMYVYLCGPMDYAADGGSGWRDKLSRFLLEEGFDKERILNPCDKTNILSAQDWDEKALTEQYHKEGNIEKRMEVIDKIVHIDLRCVDKSDFVIVYVPKLISEEKLTEIKDEFDMCDFGGYRESEKRGHKIVDELISIIKKIQTPTYGTIHEMVVARQQRKPVFLVWEGGKEHCSGWLMWLVGHENVFSTLEELETTIKNIKNGSFVPKNMKDWLVF